MTWRRLALLPLLALFPWLTFAQAGSTDGNPASGASIWQSQSSNSTAGLRGIHAVGNGVAWASGTKGTVLRTEDGGYLWQTCSVPPGAEKLDFRGIWAWDADTALVMSSGPGDQSRIYKTTDGCHSWKLLFTNLEKDGFWDAIQFSDRQNGVLLGDPVNGHFTVGITKDGGQNWDFSTAQGPAVEADSQAAFAASNSSLGFGKLHQSVHFATGGRGGARFYLRRLSPEQNPTSAWTAFSVPLTSGTESSGVFSLAIREDDHGVAVGGDYKKPSESEGTAAWTADGGRHWAAATKPPHGYRSAVAWDKAARVWIAIGTNGTDVSYDDGRTWQSADDGNWNALSLPWVVGPNGHIGKLISLKVKPAAAK